MVVVVVIVYLPICLSVCKRENAAILRHFLNFWTWQRQKRNNSARLPQFLNLTTSKTKQFCETSSISGVDDIKNETILRDFLQKWKVQCRADGLVPISFAIFPLHLSKVLRLPRKSDARSYEVLHLSRKIISPKLKIWCSKMQALSGNQRPDLLTSLINMSLVLRLPRKMHLCRSSSNVPRLPSFLDMLQNPNALLTFDKVHNPLRLPRETTSERQKVVRTCGVFNILTSKCASRHNGARFFDISTSNTFWLRNVLRAAAACTFSTSQLPKVLRTWGVFCTFWLRNVLRATTACNFSISQLPKVVRTWCVLYILHFDFEMRFAPQRRAIFHLSSGQLAPHPPLSRAYFSTLRSHKSLENTVFRDFPTFSRSWIFFLLRLSLSSLFFSDSSHLCFSICPYCRKFDF